MQLALAVLFACGIFLIFVGLARLGRAPSRVDVVAQQYAAPSTLEQVEMAKPFSERVLRPALVRLLRLLMRLAPKKIVESTQVKLELAGRPFDVPALEFLGLCVLSAILTALVFVALFRFLHGPIILLILFFGVGLTLGFYFPLLWLNMKIKERQQDISLTLSDALDLLTVCVEAGMALDAAMAQVSQRWDNHLGRAFRRVLHELRLGKPRHVALRDMADHAEVKELTNFVAALIQAELHGAPIARVLRIQSEQMRVLRRTRAHERANRMPIQLLFPLIFLIFPSLFVVLLGPAVIRLMGGFH